MSSKQLLSGFPITCPTYIILLDLTTLIIFGGDYKSFTLYNFLWPPVTSFLLGPDIFHSTLFLNAFCVLSVS